MAGLRLTNAYAAMVVLALPGGCNIFVAVSWWALLKDRLRRFSGWLSGVLNMANNLGGVISPVLTPVIAARYGWIAALDAAAVVILSMGAL